jgi:hypothetical protein
MRVSCTTIESFRLFMDPNQEWMPEGELLATIKGEFIATPRMALGQAFGRCLEKPAKYRDEANRGYLVPVDGRVYRFSDAVMEPALAEFDRRGVFEAKETRDYGGTKVVAKADQILGTRVIENKAKTSQFDFDKYAESYQWRFMLDLFEGATSVTYKIFLLNEDERSGDIDLRGIETFNLYPYAELHRDCADMVRQFEDYVRLKGLTEFLNNKQRETESRYAQPV